MLRKCSIVVLSLLCSALCAGEPQNLAFAKKALARYHDSQEYGHQIIVVVNHAMDYLKTHLDKKFSKKPAIILDIDETSLSNYQDIARMNFGGTIEDIDHAIATGKDPAIQPTLKLYQYAEDHHIAIFFVTGRSQTLHDATIQNLKKVGFHDWQGIYFRPPHYQEKTIAIYKTAAREQIEKQGYHIVLNLGDQLSDLEGGHADKTYKLPNPYYFLP